MKGHLTRTINNSYLLYPFILLHLLPALQFLEQETPEHLFPVKWTHGQHPISNADRLTNKPFHSPKVHDTTPVNPTEHIPRPPKFHHEKRVCNQKPGLIPTINITIPPKPPRTRLPSRNTSPHVLPDVQKNNLPRDVAIDHSFLSQLSDFISREITFSPANAPCGETLKNNKPRALLPGHIINSSHQYSFQNRETTICHNIKNTFQGNIILK